MMEETRENAWTLLTQYNDDEALLRHALAVEGVMRHFARLYGEDEQRWGIVGLLHDLDYQRYAQQHCHKTMEILREAGWSEPVARATASHGYGVCCEIEPKSQMEKVLYTVDELTGLIYATALMRPSRSVMDLTLKSVMKKYKQPSFAAGVKRELIERGAALCGLERDKVIEETILGMREVAGAIGLAGLGE